MKCSKIVKYSDRVPWYLGHPCHGDRDSLGRAHVGGGDRDGQYVERDSVQSLEAREHEGGAAGDDPGVAPVPEAGDHQGLARTGCGNVTHCKHDDFNSDPSLLQRQVFRAALTNQLTC